MPNLPLGFGSYTRSSGSEPEIRLENRYFETNPTDDSGSALLARVGTTQLTAVGDGPIRRNFTKPGLFDGDLFVVSGPELWRHNDAGDAQVTGTVQGTGSPNFAWMKGIGYEYLFIADGLLLQYYAGGSHATGVLTADTYDYVWTSQTSANDDDWRGICWAPTLGLFAAVALNDASGGAVMTSPDGITWTAHTSPTQGLRGVCWSPDLSLLVAVGSAGAVVTSTNGTSWTARTSPSVADFYSVCWSPALSLFIAVGIVTGIESQVITSPDGVNWTAQTAATANNWFSVCWSPELSLFCAVAASGIGNRVMTSPDGANWQAQVSPSDIEWSGVCWSPELLTFCGIADGKAMLSTDGAAWTLYDIPDTGGHGLGAAKVVWSTELRLFTTVGTYGVATSQDGQTWTLRTAASSNSWVDVVWSPDLFLFAAVATTGTGNRVMTSTAHDTPVIAGQVIEIGGTYYSWDTDVDNGAPDGTASNPWLAALGADDVASLANMAKLLNYAGTPGVDFSTALTGPSDVVTASAIGFSLIVSSIATDATGNTITTSVYLGTDVSWGAATLTGGNVHVLTPIAVPDEQPALALASLAGFVLVSIANSQKIFFIRPGAVTIDSLDFFEKEVAPDNVVDMNTVGDFIFTAGSGSTEVLYATGDGNAPFAPMSGGTYERGMVASTPVVMPDGSFAFVGNDLKVYLLKDGAVNRISNHGIEERVRRWFRAQEGLTP